MPAFDVWPFSFPALLLLSLLHLLHKRFFAFSHKQWCHLVMHILSFTNLNILHNFQPVFKNSRSQWPCGLRRGYAAAWLLRLWVRIPTRPWHLSCEFCVLSGRGLWDGPIPRWEELCRVRRCHCIIRSNTYNEWVEEVRLRTRERKKERKKKKF